MIKGAKITLAKCTNELWHDFYKNYVSDPMMENTNYKYDYEKVENAYLTKTADITRLYFFIMHKDKVIGQIYLKHIDAEKKTTELGIALINDSVKEKGFGTEAISLLVDYAFFTLKFKKVFAKTVLKNSRSQHILEKLGFAKTGENIDFYCYKKTKPRQIF